MIGGPRRVSAAALVGAALVVGAPRALADEYIDYWGDDLFLGLVFHRFGCHAKLGVITSNQDYDGFSHARYCFVGEWWDAPGERGYHHLGWNHTAGREELDACGDAANDILGTPGYADRSTRCTYNTLTECNSDCWIREFSTCQGKPLAILSPCF